MPDNPGQQVPAEPIAIVGMACRFPDAGSPADFLELVLTGRRAFRTMPPVRLDTTEYGDAEAGAGAATRAIGSARAALIEGWQFDRAAYGVTQAAYRAADPAHWLALETAARALTDGGFPGGQGLTRDRTGVVIGNTLTGEVSRATAMRSRWPYVRRVLRAALAAGDISPERHADVIEHAAAGFLAPFPEIGDDTLAGGLPGAIADRICGHFGFRGGGHAVDAAHSSSLLAIAAACSALAAGDLDAAIAGGVDISLDPHELAGLAGTGALASGDMRVFDARPTGFLPGEGCGLAVLMRAADARAAGIPAYAEIAGWGVSSAGNPALTKPGSASLLLALRRAYHRAGVDPADVQLIEGDGTGTASGDLAELTSLAEIRQGSPRLAALGSVKANIGHAKAAAGAAGLIKATLAIAAGVIPPATGCVRPHPLIASEDARLRVPRAAEPWPERARLAGVSSVGPGGTSVHVILRRTRDGRRRRAPGTPQLRGSGPAVAGQDPSGASTTAGRAAVSPAEGPSGASAAEGPSGISPAEGRAPVSPAEGPSRASTAAGRAAVSPAEGQAPASPAEGPSRASAAEGPSGASAAAGRAGISPAAGRAPVSPAEGPSGASAESLAGKAEAWAGSAGNSAGDGAATPVRRGGSIPLPIPVLAHMPGPDAFVFAAADRQALARELSRVAELAPWLSDGELHDLACQTGRAVAGQGQVRAGLVASGQAQLAQRAREAVALLPGLRQGSLATAPGVVMAENARGRVTLLFPGEGGSLPGPSSAANPADEGARDPALHPAVLAASLAGLRWLEELGLQAAAGVGHGLGEITGLVWAGCLAEPDASRLVAQRAALLATPAAERTALICVDADGPAAKRLCGATGLVVAAYNGPRCHMLAGPVAAVRDLARRLAEDGIPARVREPLQACYFPAAADRVAAMGSIVGEFSFQPPSRRLISTITGRQVSGDDGIGSMLCTQLTSPVAFAAALELAIADADLAIETGPGDELSRLAADCSDVPAISLAGGRGDQQATARVVAAALFASGAVATLAPLFEARRSRRIDIWRERVFIPSPCGTAPPRGVAAADHTTATDTGDLIMGGDPAARGTAGDGAMASKPVATGDGAAGGTKAGAGGPAAPGVTTGATVQRPAGPRETRPSGEPHRTPAAGQPAEAGPAGTTPGTGAPVAESGEMATRPGTASSTAGMAGPAPLAAGSAPLAAGRSDAAPRSHATPQPQTALPQASTRPQVTPQTQAAHGSPAAAQPQAAAGQCQPGPLRASGAQDPDAPPGEATAPATAVHSPERDGSAGTGSLASPSAPASPGTPSTPGMLTTIGSQTATGTPATGTPATGSLASAGTKAGTVPQPAATQARRPAPARMRPGDQDHAVPGAGPWIRCFTEERRPARPPDPPRAGAGWRIPGSTPTAFRKISERIFTSDTDADTVLALAGDPAEPAACAALLGAVREAQSTGRLVVITSAAGLTGFWASLHAEQPDLGITLIRTAPGPAGLEAARRYAVAAPGQFREVILDKAGAGTEPVMVSTDPAADGTFPLGPADVVLVTGITRAGDLACATSLAGRGAALAVIAPPGPEDPQLAACLAQLRAAGVRVSRKKADLNDPGQVAAAVRSLERGLGPVTALVHAAASGPVERLATLPEQALRGFLASQRARFSNVARAVATERLRVLVTFGSVAARYGRSGGGCDALASELLAEQAWSLAGGRPRCRVLHIDWGPWAVPEPAGPEPAVRADGPPARPAGGRSRAAALPPGTAPIPVEEGSRLLLSLLTTSDIPPRVAVHGRLGVPAPQALRPGEAAPGRFLETVRVHYPGVELVADTRLSVPADPYLADYRIDGVAVFPAAMVLEAMAQAASALTGRPQRHLTDVFLAAPVVLPAGREESVIRVCALRAGDTVETVLRCAQTGFRLDHARAVFRAAAGPGAPGPAGQNLSGRGQAGDYAAPGGVVDGTDLYGQVYFQAGRFRRVAFLPEASSRACRALVRGGDDQPWFGAIPGPVDAPMILGSPGLNDATLHVLQACLPHRRVLPTACESVTFSGEEVRGALRVQAARRLSEDGGARGAWDVVATDATGRPAVTWRGVRSRDVGTLARKAAWHPALLAISVESRAADFGLDPSLRALISCGTPPRTASTRSFPAPGDGSAATLPPRSLPAPGDGWADKAPGRGPLDGFELTVRAARPVACRWQAVGAPREEAVPLDTALIALRQQLEVRSREPLAAALARLDTIASCLAALGREPGTPLALEDACDGGWIVVRAAEAVVACTVTEISGVPAPVAVAIASRLADSGTEGSPPSGQRGTGQPIGSLRLALSPR